MNKYTFNTIAKNGPLSNALNRNKSNLKLTTESTEVICRGRNVVLPGRGTFCMCMAVDSR